MSDLQELTAGQARRAGILAALATSLCVAAAGGLASWLRPRSCASTEDVVSLAVLVVAALALMRLAWGCAATAAAFFGIVGRASGTVSTPVPLRGPTGPANEEIDAVRPVAPRGRIAGFFLALATVSVLTTQAANASPAPPSPSFSASMTLDASPSPGVPDTPLPGFVPSARASDRIGPASTAPPTQIASATSRPEVAEAGRTSQDRSPNGQTSQDRAAQDQASQDHLDQVVAAITHRDGERLASPLPGWTPSTRADTPRAAPLVLGSVRDHSSSERRQHVVVRGDSLWSIAAQHLAPDAPPEQVLRAVDGWLQANPQLRPHPGLLQPGQVLAVPDDVTSRTPCPDWGTPDRRTTPAVPFATTPSGDLP